MIKFRDNLLEKLKEKGYSSYRLDKEKIFGHQTLQNLRTGAAIPNQTLNKLCEILDCKIEDVIEFVPDCDEGR